MADGLLDLERLRAATQAARQRLAVGEGPQTLTPRVKARMVHNTKLEAQVGAFRLVSDERAESGGEEAGPSPLQYFLAGIGFWLLSHLARFAPVHGVQLQRAEVDVRAEFDRASQLGGGVSSAARRVIYSLSVESDAAAAEVGAVVREAVAACYTLQSLASPVPLDGRAELNGEPLGA